MKYKPFKPRTKEETQVFRDLCRLAEERAANSTMRVADLLESNRDKAGLLVNAAHHLLVGAAAYVAKDLIDTGSEDDMRSRAMATAFLMLSQYLPADALDVALQVTAKTAVKGRRK